MTPLAFVPGATMWLLRPRRTTDGGQLVLLRHVFVSIVATLVLFGVVLLRIELEPAEDPVIAPWLGLVAAAAVLSLVGLRFGTKPLVCEHLAESYRTRFFLRLAFADAVALWGFVAALAVPNRWLYFPAAAFTLVVLARLAPTRANIERDHERLRAAGCAGSIYDALA